MPDDRHGAAPNRGVVLNRGAAARGGWPIDVALAAGLGALHSLPFVRTEAWWLQLLVVVGLVWRIAGLAPRRAALTGLVFGSAWLGAGTWWLFISLHRYGGLPAALTVLVVALLCASLSLYLAAAMYGLSRWRCGRPAADALLFGALWLLAELARGIIFTGFPWVASGYAHVDGPLAALAPWIGVYGIGFVAAVLAAWVGLPKRRGGWSQVARALVAAGLLGGLAALGPGRFSDAGGTLAVTLLQSNVAQDEKFSNQHLPQALDWTVQNLRSARGELVIAPETVIPLLPEQLPSGYWPSLLRRFHDGPQAALIGLPLGDPVAGYTNSAAGISAATARLPGGFHRYDKHHLVPFGEFIPTGFRWFTELMNIPLGDFNRGPLSAPSFRVVTAAGQVERVAPNICYEDLFGEELAARFTVAADAPTIFANISNIAWFGDTIAIPQHMHISRMRTLEFERPMLRATNTGATVVIDHHGVVRASLAPYTRGVLEGSVQGRTGLTPFARWAGVAGVWPLWIGAGLIVLAAVVRSRIGRH